MNFFFFFKLVLEKQGHQECVDMSEKRNDCHLVWFAQQMLTVYLPG